LLVGMGLLACGLGLLRNRLSYVSALLLNAGGVMIWARG
jgi:hypothetical protein